MAAARDSEKQRAAERRTEVESATPLLGKGERSTHLRAVLLIVEAHSPSKINRERRES